MNTTNVNGSTMLSDGRSAVTELYGDVVATGPGVVASVIQPGVVDWSKVQNVSGTILLGRYDSGSGSVQEIALGTNLSFSGNVLNATGCGGGGSFDADTILTDDYGDVLVDEDGNVMCSE